MNDFKEKLIIFITNYPGTVIGCLTGLLAGLLLITFGPVKVATLLICIALGFIIGKMRDQQ